eukprot:CCRYP_010952-RA/>CCRYP_010952-RA protein AED:0.60 eAED:0.60 QI:0/0/0/0.5/1/1/2/0/75
MERLEAKGEERLASSGYDASLRPSLMVWDVPTMSKERMSRREPDLHRSYFKCEAKHVHNVITFVVKELLETVCKG